MVRPPGHTFTFLPGRIAMPRWTRFGALMFLLAGCGSGTAPLAILHSTLTVTRLPSGSQPPYAAATIVAAGDSVVTTHVSGYSSCYEFAAGSVALGNALGVTVSTQYSAVLDCAQVIAYAQVRVVVRPIPAGRYDVVLGERFVPARGSPGPTKEVARQSVVVR